jgi:hypothetical protein
VLENVVKQIAKYQNPRVAVVVIARKWVSVLAGMVDNAVPFNHPPWPIRVDIIARIAQM